MLPCNKEAPMQSSTDQWTKALETWQGMIPPLANPAVMDPWQAVRVSMGIQRAALACWRDSCVQAHDLGSKALDWQAGTRERLASAGQESAR
jgi:hypothetical protein